MMVRTISTAVLIAIVTLRCCAPAFAEDLASDRFMSALTTPVSISPFAINPDHYSRLSQEQRRAVLSAKEVLSSFFRSLETQEKNINRFLAPDFLSRKLTTEALRRSLISDETSIIQLGVSDLEPKGDGHLLDLEFYAVMISEGTFSVGKGMATMTKTKDGWKVLAIKIST